MNFFQKNYPFYFYIFWFLSVLKKIIINGPFLVTKSHSKDTFLKLFEKCEPNKVCCMIIWIHFWKNCENQASFDEVRSGLEKTVELLVFYTVMWKRYVAHTHSLPPLSPSLLPPSFSISLPPPISLTSHKATYLSSQLQMIHGT